MPAVFCADKVPQGSAAVISVDEAQTGDAVAEGEVIATIYAAREDLPLEEGDNFIEDLIGLPVVDAESGKQYGTLAGVINTGASDIYEIDTEDGIRMIPAVDEFIKEIDLEKGIFITPIEGMFD